jgi:hypothetical protein
VRLRMTDLTLTVIPTVTGSNGDGDGDGEYRVLEGNALKVNTQVRSTNVQTCVRPFLWSISVLLSALHNTVEAQLSQKSKPHVVNKRSGFQQIESRTLSLSSLFVHVSTPKLHLPPT